MKSCIPSEILRIHHILEDTTAEGFGHRMCIWVQGCSNRCPDCMAKDTWDHNGGFPLAVSQLIEKMRQCRSKIEGITLLGGEPFDQALPVSRVANEAKKMGLSVITFTGYTLNRLMETELPGVKELLRATDLLIDGPYIREQRSFSRPWVGSDNQQFHFLSNRYKPEDLEKVHNRIEMRIGRDGTLQTNGMADFSALFESLLEPSKSDGLDGRKNLLNTDEQGRGV